MNPAAGTTHALVNISVRMGRRRLAGAQRALVMGERDRAQLLSDQIFEQYQIRFALEPGASGPPP